MRMARGLFLNDLSTPPQTKENKNTVKELNNKTSETNGFPHIASQGVNKKANVSKEAFLKEAAQRLKDGEFSIHELAETAGVSEATAREFARKAGMRPGSERGKFRAEPESDSSELKEIPAELYIAAYMKGFDAGFQRGFDVGVKTVN